MNPQLFNIKYLLEKSLLLSILIHGLIFSTFIFVWPVIPEPHKPNLIFLGSILQKSDIVVNVLPQSNGGQRPLNNLSFTERQSRLFDSTPVKPYHEAKYLPENKRTIKPVPEQKEDERETNKLLEKDAEIDLSIEPYKPLRLKPHD